MYMYVEVTFVYCAYGKKERAVVAVSCELYDAIMQCMDMNYECIQISFLKRFHRKLQLCSSCSITRVWEYQLCYHLKSKPLRNRDFCTMLSISTTTKLHR